MNKIRIGVMISGKGSNMKAIISACQKRWIDGEVVVVGSDNPNAEGLKFAQGKKIPTIIANYKKAINYCQKKSISELRMSGILPTDFKFEEVIKNQQKYRKVMPFEIAAQKYFYSRAIAEAKLFEKLKPYGIDLLVLAGFMYVLTSYFIDKFNVGDIYRIMNIHPALLPAFPGEHGYEDTFNYGCKVGGCTVHFVDYGKDTGPIIGQMAYEVKPEDTIESVKQKGLVNEWQLYPRCIQLFAEGRLRIVESKGRKIVQIGKGG